MNSYLVKLIILMLFMLVTPPVCLASEEANELTLLYSNNVNGEIEPCG